MAKRRYSSELREQQAAATRERVVRAAAELFAARGYAGTSLPQIARHAGVSTETVQAHGPKLHLLRAAIDQLSFAADDGTPLLDTPLGSEFRRATSAEDAARISADILSQVNQATHGIWLAFSEAARTDESLAREFTALAGRIRGENLTVLRLWRERFLDRWQAIKALGFDETFRRKWIYYLAYCEAGFEEGSIDVGIYQYRKPI